MLSVLFFYAIPRFSMPVIRGNPILRDNSLEFPTEVKIDSEEVSLNYQVIMRVETNVSKGPIYISGLRYSTFSNGKWIMTYSKSEKINKDLNGYFVSDNGNKATIYLEPTGTNVIFKVDYATGVSGSFNYIFEDNNENWFFDTPFYRTIKYDTYYSNEPKKEELTQTQLEKFLDVSNINPLIIKLSENITKGKNSESEKIEAIVKYLHENNAYSLSPTAKTIDDFILTHKSGYCEHFATAFTLLARASGIPTRLVSGFSTSEWNDTFSYYIVRAKDAHSWAEVYTNNSWHLVDPTPTQSSDNNRFSLFIDSIRMFWYRNVVSYSIEAQAQALQNLSIFVKNFGNVVFNILKILKNFAFYLLILIIAFAIFLFKKSTDKPDYIAQKIISLIGNDRENS
jgi:transglutaminase-like putative cysteine protease